MILLPYGYKSGKILLAELDPEHYITDKKAVISKLSGSVWNTPIVPIYSNESLELTEEEHTELTADWRAYQEFLATQEPIEKADSYKPTAGMVTAAKRALRWKEEGKAKGAGTPVGWGRATDIASGRTMSLDVVKRMFSFFSRHEVDKQGKDFDNTSEPSNGRIMWDAWGGDAGFTWSRTIVEREKKKLEKHLAGKHDQSSHGRGGAKMGQGVAASILERVKENGGLSVQMIDGSEPTTGYMVAKGSQYGSISSAADFYDPVKGPKILADYMKKNKADLATGKNYLGLWHNKDDGNVYLDISENVLDLDDAKQRGSSRDQISIWDVANFAEIETGGTGNVGKNRGRKFAQFVRNDGRRNRGLRTVSMGQAGETTDASNDSQTLKPPADLTIPIKYRLGKVLLGELTHGMFITKGKIPVYKSSLLSVSELDLLPYWGSEKIELTNAEYNEMTRGYFMTLKRPDQ
jgi:hypothetical protein